MIEPYPHLDPVKTRLELRKLKGLTFGSSIMSSLIWCDLSIFFIIHPFRNKQLRRIEIIYFIKDE